MPWLRSGRFDTVVRRQRQSMTHVATRLSHVGIKKNKKIKKAGLTDIVPKFESCWVYLTPVGRLAPKYG
jgi:hypothetical protein